MLPETIPESARYELIPCPSSECLKLNGAPGTQKYHKTCCQLCGGWNQVHGPVKEEREEMARRAEEVRQKLQAWGEKLDEEKQRRAGAAHA